MVCAATLIWINQTSFKFRGRDYLSFSVKFASFVKLDTKKLPNHTLRQLFQVLMKWYLLRQCSLFDAQTVR
jgi:hypothetical protein